jgi:hypothetical protein
MSCRADALRDPERFVNLHDAIILLVENSSSQVPAAFGREVPCSARSQHTALHQKWQHLSFCWPLTLLSFAWLQTPGMQAAQELLRRLRHRDIYKHCGSADVQRVGCRFWEGHPCTEA